MKRNSKHIAVTAAIALCAGSTLPFLAGSSTLDPERDSVKSEVPYCVTRRTGENLLCRTRNRLVALRPT